MEKTSKFYGRRLLACLLAAMILLSAAGCQTKVEQATAPVQDESIAVETQTPQIGDLALTTEFIGTIEPDEQVSVIPKVGGTVLHTYAEVGQTVKKGDLLFEIDDSDAALAYRMAQAGYEQRMISADTTLGSGYESRVLAAKAQVDAAQQNLNNTRLKLKDYNDGYDDSLIMAEKRRDEAEQKMKAAEEAYENAKNDPDFSGDLNALELALEDAENEYSRLRSKINALEDSEDSEARDLRNAYKNAQTNYEQALNNYNLLLGGSLEDTQRAMEADLKSAELSLEQSASTLDKYKIYAPIDGVIEQKNISEQSLASPSSVAYTLSNKSTIMTTFYVPSGAVEQMAVGDSVTIENGQKSYTGSIAEIGTMVDPQTGLFKVKAQIDSDDGMLQTGLSVKVTATTGKARQSLLLPQENIYYEDGEAYVYLNVDGTAVRTPIVTGLSNEETVEVLSGLTSSDQVIVSWNANLTDGAKVRGTNETVSPQEPASESAASAADDSPASQTGTSTSDSSAVVPSQSAEASSEG